MKYKAYPSLLLLFCVTNAHADLITYNFTAKIFNIYGGYDRSNPNADANTDLDFTSHAGFLFKKADPISGSFTYESSTPGTLPSSNSQYFFDALTDFKFSTISGFTFSLPDSDKPGYISTQDSSYADMNQKHDATFRLGYSKDTISSTVSTYETAQISLYDATGTAFNVGPTLPESGLELSSFTSAQMLFGGYDRASYETTNFAIIANLDSLTLDSIVPTTDAPVPIPTSLWLLGSALAGILGFSRRKI